jgi:predicted acylesterase/phospholipase RssA/CRP-like cAMP-binding protein
VTLAGLEALANTPNFAGCPPPLLEGALSDANLVLLEAGQLLVSEGEAPDRAFVLVTGELTVTRTIRGQEVAIASIREPGTVIGEVAILAGGKRNATVRATSQSVLAELTRTGFEQMLIASPALSARLAREALGRIERTEFQTFLIRAFGTDDAELLDDLADMAEWMRVPGGTVVFSEGDKADAAYVVVSGRLGVTKQDQAPGTRPIELSRGEVFGELGLLEGGIRSATVTALRDSVLVKFPEEVFNDLIERRPRQMVDLARSMVRRVLYPPRRRRGAMVVAMAVTADTNRHRLFDRLAGQFGRLGLTEHLSPARCDSLLGREGASGADSGDPAAVTLVRLLQELELACSYLILEADGVSAWRERTFRHSDRVVVVCSQNPASEERDRIRRMLALANPTAQKILVALHHDSEVAGGSAALLDETGADQLVHILDDDELDYGRLTRIIAGRTFGLVLSGGGARGFGHIGVYKAMTELGIPIDWVGGSSIGAVFAAAIARRLSPEELETETPRLFHGVLDYTVPIVSLTKGAQITKNLDEVFGDMEIEDLWKGFFCVSTNLTHSGAQVHSRGALARAVRASLAIPGVIPPVPWGEDLLVDGGVIDNLPVGVMRQLHPECTLIGVDLAPSLGPKAQADFGLSVSGWKALAARTGLSKSDGFPRMAAILLRSMITASEAQRFDKVAACDLYLDLELRGVGVLDFDVVAPVVAKGYEAARPQLAEWWAAQGLAPG